MDPGFLLCWGGVASDPHGCTLQLLVDVLSGQVVIDVFEVRAPRPQNDAIIR